MGIKEFDDWHISIQTKMYQNKLNSAKTKEEWKKAYNEFLRSPLWKTIKNKIRDRSKGCCEICGVKGKKLQIHHLTYSRVGGKEMLNDLKAVCYPCHQKADRVREEITYNNQLERIYESRVIGFAEKCFGEDWDYEYCFSEVEEKFQLCMFKKYCSDTGFDYYPGLEDDDAMLFLDVCNLLLNNKF